jgi:8-oxo-dGTP pyrophosphatase MutT (NUDIX family)
MFVIENPNWVNIVPITTDNHIILVEQWRHGTQSVHLETPGGLIDENESVEECSRRELLEETGYRARDIIRLATVHPNPAIQCNVQHYVLASGCEKVAEPAPDAAEDIEVHLVPLAQMPKLIEQGKITHALVINAFYWYEIYRRGESRGATG